MQIFKIISAGTIEEKVEERQAFKKQLAEKVLQNIFAERKVTLGYLK